MKYLKKLKHLFLFLLSLNLVSCTYLSQNMRSDEEKMVDLEKLVATTHKIYSWQDFDKLVPMIDGLPNQIMRDISKAYKGVKFNEVSVDQVTYKDGLEKAYSVFEIKSFRNPSFVVESHFDQIEWIFKASEGGWRIKSISIGKSKELE